MAAEKRPMTKRASGSKRTTKAEKPKHFSQVDAAVRMLRLAHKPVGALQPLG